MKRLLLPGLAAVCAILFSCSKSNDDNGGGSGGGTPKVSISESSDAITMTYSQEEVPGMKVDVEYKWTFNSNDCTSCIVKQTYPSAEIAAAVYEALTEDPQNGIAPASKSAEGESDLPSISVSLQGRSVISDLTALYAGNSKETVRAVAESLKQTIENGDPVSPVPGPGDEPAPGPGDDPVPGPGDGPGFDPSEYTVTAVLGSELMPFGLEADDAMGDFYIVVWKDGSTVKTARYGYSDWGGEEADNLLYLDYVSGDAPTVNGTTAYLIFLRGLNDYPTIANDGSFSIDLTSQLNGPALVLSGSGYLNAGQMSFFVDHHCALYMVDRLEGFSHNESYATVRLCGPGLVTSLGMQLTATGYQAVPVRDAMTIDAGYQLPVVDGAIENLRFALFPSEVDGPVRLSAKGDGYMYDIVLSKDDLEYLEPGEVVRFNSLKLNPSGVKLYNGSPYWAFVNLGAEAAGDNGDWFTWGNIDGHADLSWWQNMQNHPYDATSGSTLTGNIPQRGNNDAAWVNWGGTWRLPTQVDLDNLTSKCSVAWTQAGAVFTGKGDYAGCSITLPWCGINAMSDAYSSSAYWSSTYYKMATNQKEAFALTIYYNEVGPYEGKEVYPIYCGNGCGIRPVAD